MNHTIATEQLRDCILDLASGDAKRRDAAAVRVSLALIGCKDLRQFERRAESSSQDCFPSDGVVKEFQKQVATLCAGFPSA